MTLSRVHGLMKPIDMSFLAPSGHPYGTKTSQMGCTLMIYHKCKTAFHQIPFWSIPGPFQCQFWNGSIPLE